jgi:hypothetical protein
VAFLKMGPAYATPLQGLRPSGTKLCRAVDKASKGGPGTWNQRTALPMAEEAKELGELVDVYLPAKVLIAASSKRSMKKRK